MQDSNNNFCAVCNKPIPSGTDLCSVCASEATARTQTIVCGKCQTLMPIGSNICNCCNSLLESSSKPSVPQLPVPKREDSRHHIPKPSDSMPPVPKRTESIPPVPKRTENMPSVPRNTDSVPPVPKRSDSIPPVPRRTEAKNSVENSAKTYIVENNQQISAEMQKSEPVSRPSDIRATELGMLIQCFASTVENSKATQVLVTGDAGMGVSLVLKTLVSRLSEKLPKGRVCFLVTREFDEPFFPFSRVLRELFANDYQLSGMTIRQSISHRISRLLKGESTQIIAETAHIIAYVAGVPFEDSPILDSLQKDQDLMYMRLKTSLLRYFRAELKQQPFVLVWDDVHRFPIDSKAGRLFVDIFGLLKDLPILAVCGGRLELLKMIAPDNAVTVRLEPLSDSVMRRLFFELLPKLTNPPVHLIEGTIKKAAGNPGTLYELCLLLQESGAINTEGEEWIAADNPQQINEMLSDRRDALRARLDQIDPRDRMVLQTASVFGDVFWDEAIVAMSRLTIRLKDNIQAAQIWADDADSLAISHSIERLVEKKFLVRLDETDVPFSAKYAFSRSNIREKIVVTIDEKLCQRYHFLAAEWLQHMASKSSLPLSELEAVHWLAAGCSFRAAKACFRAAEYARACYLHQRAIELYQQGLDLIEPDERLDRIDVLHNLGSIYELQGKWEEAEKCLTEMLRNAWILGHRNKAGAALNKIGRLYRLRGDSIAGRAFLNRAMTLFKAVGDERGIASCLCDLGDIARQDGSFEKAFNMVRESFELHRKLKNRRSMALCLQIMGNIDSARAFYERADRFFNEALEMRRKANDRGGTAQTLLSLAAMVFNQGDLQGAKSRFEAALELAQEVGDRRMEAQARNGLGEICRETRDYQTAVVHFKDAEEIAKSQKDRLMLGDVSRNLAAIAAKLGDVTKGRKYVNRSMDIAKKLGAKEMEALAYRALGELESNTMWDTSKTDGQDEATEAFLSALQIFRALGNDLETARTLHALGKRMLERGDISQSHTVLTEARDIYKKIDPKISESIERTIIETSGHA